MIVPRGPCCTAQAGAVPLAPRSMAGPALAGAAPAAAAAAPIPAPAPRRPGAAARRRALVGDPVTEILGDQLGGHGREQLALPGLCAPVPADLTDRDAVQPRLRIGIRTVVGAAPAERGQERLRGDLLPDVGTEPRAGEAEDRAAMPGEDCGEASGLAQRARDQVGVACQRGLNL